MKNTIRYAVIIFVISLIYCNKSFSINTTIESDDQKKLEKIAPIAYSTKETIQNTFAISLECIKNNIEGDFVECGVAGGAQIAAMALASQKLNAKKRIHLFDSFEGIPLAGPNDTAQPGVGDIEHSVNVKQLDDLLISSNLIYSKLGNAACSTVDQVQNNMRRLGVDEKNLIYYKGWFQHVLPIDANKIEKISFLRLDGDLYESTKICLEYLYPKISKGGYIVIDDYTSLEGCKKAVHEYLQKNNLTPNIIPVPGGLGPVYWKVD